MGRGLREHGHGMYEWDDGVYGKRMGIYLYTYRGGDGDLEREGKGKGTGTGRRVIHIPGSKYLLNTINSCCTCSLPQPRTSVSHTHSH